MYHLTHRLVWINKSMKKPAESKGKLHSKIISSDLIAFFSVEFDGKGKSGGQNLNRKTVKQTAKKWHVRAFVMSVVPPRNHAGSRERFEMFMIGRNHFVGDPP